MANNAQFVAQSLPKIMVPGGTYSVSVTMRNTGTVPWTKNAGFKLGSQNPRDNMIWGVNRAWLPDSITVSPGATHTFVWNLVAPSVPGMYSFQWRMVQELVEWFGEVSPLVSVGNGFVKVVGNSFRVGSTSWYPYGINYFPLNSINPPAGPPFFSIPAAEHWFLPGVYDECATEADLALLESLGMNMVAVGLPLNPTTKPNVVDFLNRCVMHGLRVYVELPTDQSSPTDAPKKAETTAKALAALSDPILNLPGRTEVFAYSLAWEPHLGWRDNPNVRVRWNRMFTRWLTSTFGGPLKAAEALGYTIKPPGTPGLGWQAGCESYTLPVVARAGANITVAFTFKNLGEHAWADKDDGKLLGWLPGGGEYRFPFQSAVPPGGSMTTSGSFSVPATPGRYVYEFRMVHEKDPWFAFGEALEIEVEVVATGSTIMRTIPLKAIPAPTNNEILGQEPPSKNWVLAYRRALDAEVSRRFGRVARLVRMRAPNQLLTARQGIDGNDGESVIWFPLDAPSTGAHFDFLCPENYFYDNDTADGIRSAVAVQTAYARWASGGRPVCWIEFGRSVDTPPSEARLASQAAFAEKVVNAVLEVGADGIAPWWYPGGKRGAENSDYGIVNADRTARPSANKLASMAMRAKAPRNLLPPGPAYVFNPAAGSKGFADVYAAARLVALQTLTSQKSFVMKHVGEGTSSDSPIARIGTFGSFTRDLWADLYKVELKVSGQSWFEITTGQVYAVPANTPFSVRGQVKNLGVASWVAGNVRFGANENFGATFRWGIPNLVPRFGEVTIPELLLSNGITQDTLYQFQMVAENKTWIDGPIRILLIPLA